MVRCGIVSTYSNSAIWFCGKRRRRNNRNKRRYKRNTQNHTQSNIGNASSFLHGNHFQPQENAASDVCKQYGWKYRTQSAPRDSKMRTTAFRRRAAANAARKAREKAQPKANLKQTRFLTSPCRLRHARTAAILRKRQAAPRAHALDRKSRPDRRGGHGRALIGVNLSSQAARC